MSNDRQHTALLVMDMQNAMLKGYPNIPHFVGKAAAAIAHARSKGIPVFFVVLGFREDAPEISDRNKLFTARKQAFASLPPQEFMTIHPDLAPLPKEPVIIKRRVSAFSGSDLEVLLRAQQIEHIILSGIATSGIVLSTALEAADKDYSVTILSDACADRDNEVHQFLTTKILTRQAEVLTTEEWQNL